MYWNQFLYFALPTLLCWIIASFLIFTKKSTWKAIAQAFLLVGLLVYVTFIIYLWIGQHHPPLRTRSETRLWYSFFLVLIGYITFLRWHYKWLFTFSALMSCVFLCINIFERDTISSNLMPALQSYWFVFHVSVYILSYALLGAATIASIIQLYKIYIGDRLFDLQIFDFMDNLVYIGFGFLVLGLLSGAIWAKQAWGHYWSWDPKETWAFVTCAAYLIYIHIRLKDNYRKLCTWILPVAFVLLMITWVGVNYLPAARDSVHVYAK